MPKVGLLEGLGNNKGTASGEVVEWTQELIDQPGQITGKIVYSMGESPLYRMALLADNLVAGVLLEEGGKNYHPLILLGDAGVPAIGGIGKHDLRGRPITLDSASGIVRSGENASSGPVATLESAKVPPIAGEVYVNVGYPTALEAAASTGADGIGLFRTEFCSARTLSKSLSREVAPSQTIGQMIGETNEADTVYAMAKHPDLSRYLVADLADAIVKAGQYFRAKNITVRTFDFARTENDAMGNRGIRRCLAEGGHSLRVIAAAIGEALGTEMDGDTNIVVILPLVSHYSQIQTTLEILMDSGLCLRGSETPGTAAVKFGWEIEQPAASQHNEIWIEAFRRDYGRPPDVIGIGTNDLTQFTIALGRDVYSQEQDETARGYLKSLYDEKDYSVVKQIFDVSRHCRQAGVKLFLLGEAAADPDYVPLLYAFGVVPSVSIQSVQTVKRMIGALERENANPNQIVADYIDRVSEGYSEQARNFVRELLFESLEIRRNPN